MQSSLSFTLRSHDMPRVLSVQSHVVAGYVGNRAAVFPLQLLGFDVDFINSVHYSNHAGYPFNQGQALTGEQLRDVVDGLQSNHLLDYDYFLTGFIGTASFLEEVLNINAAILQKNENMKFICDPVLGDHNKYYVPEELVAIYRSAVVPKAFMITPNQFEAELLSGMNIKNEEDCITAMLRLYNMGPSIVALTSAELRGFEEMLHCFILYDTPYATQQQHTAASVTVSKLVIKKLEGHFTGTGDVTAALLLAWMDKLSREGTAAVSEDPLIAAAHPISAALLMTMASVKSMLERSIQRVRQMQQQLVVEKVNGAESSDESSRMIQCALLRAGELQVIASKADIEVPPVHQLQPVEWSTWTIPISPAAKL